MEEIQSILSNLFLDKRVDKTIARFSLPHEADDLKQDTFIALLTKPPALIADLHQRGMLFFYTVSMIKNISLKNKKAPALCALADVPDNHCELPEYRLDELPLVNGFPYFQEAVKLVAKHGNVLKAAKAVGIPVSSLRRDIIFVRSYLKSKHDC